MLKKVLIILLILMTTGCFKNPVNKALDIIDEAKLESKKRACEIIYTNLQYSILSYLYKNGDYPETLEDIENNFISDNYKFENGKIIEKATNEEYCSVTIVSDGFSVECKYLDEPKLISKY